MMKIDRNKFDELGNRIRDWFEEQGFETSVEQDLELMHIVLDVMDIDYTNLAGDVPK